MTSAGKIRERISMKKIIIYLSVISVILAPAGCGKGPGGMGKSHAVPVKVVKVKVGHLEKTLEYVGNIKGQDEAVVYPKVSGKIIEKVKEDGSLVVKGETIAYIDRDEVGLKFEKAPVESPLTGIVGRVYVDIGSSVTPQTPIALVTDMRKAEIDLNIPEKYLPMISVGQSADITVDAYPDERFTGHVTKISHVVDLQTRAAPVEISVADDSRRLRSGMLAKIRLVIGEAKGVPIVLREAVIGKEPDTYIFVIEDKKAFLKKVTLGLRQGPYLEVREGIKEGDLIVVMGQQKLRDGAIVEPEE
jgi:multidrug efflux pump subunit AcrA (membrane-fusion protein)